MKRFWLWAAILAGLIYCGLLGGGCWFVWSQLQLHEAAAYAEPDSVVSAQLQLPRPQGKPTPDSLAFGEQQVEKMMADRPMMKKYVHRGDPIWRYCVRQFAGEAVGQRIYWNSDPPEGPDSYTADHQDPTDTEIGFIRVRRY